MITTEKIVDLLNEAFKIDPICIDGILQLGTPCNIDLADHPTIQVRSKNKNGDYPVLSLLGFLNGIAALENKKIAASYNDDSHCLEKFLVLE